MIGISSGWDCYGQQTRNEALVQTKDTLSFDGLGKQSPGAIGVDGTLSQK
jgi:hypothetical protein